MRKTLLITPALVFFAAIVAPTVFEGQDINYTVNQTVGIGSMTGTITTDGTIGTLTTADTIGWNLTITDGTTTLLLTPSDSFVFDSGSALSATATAFIWNYSIGPGSNRILRILSQRWWYRRMGQYPDWHKPLGYRVLPDLQP